MAKSFVLITAMLLIFSGVRLQAQDEKDPYMWLEEVDDEKALTWVKEQNAATVEKIKKYPGFSSIEEKSLEILNFKGRIAIPNVQGDYVYNFWNDAVNERGLWRRCSLQEYQKENPAWETVLDIDALAKQENVKWVYKGASFLYPDNTRCLIRLSNGGGDAVVVREFDLQSKSFIKDGFFVPESKSSVSWKDENTLYVATNFGEGSMTESGYPRIVKIWKRGTPLTAATELYSGEKTDISVSAYRIKTKTRDYQLVYRGVTFYESKRFFLIDGKLVPVAIPDDADLNGIIKNQVLISLKSDWKPEGKLYKQGSLIAIDYDAFLQGSKAFTTLITPDERSSISDVSTTQNFVLVKMLTNVSAELKKLSYTDNNWETENVDAPKYGDISIVSADDFSDSYFYTYRSFLSPTSLYYSDENGKHQKIKSLPGFFNVENLKVEQHEAVSKDGVKIPYFLIAAKNTPMNGSNPTLILAYGGFEVSYLPFYSGTIGANWLERGGVFVLANLRGGGEFGPNWHLQAIKANRQKVNDDMIAVSEDVISRKITSPKHLGIMGGSNGGLLVGSVMVQRPELYKAVVCQVPLLDMRRYNKLLAGASWVGEYGNPDVPEEWEYISKYSPYQNLKPSIAYPQIYFVTSTRDDRVHPGHARKMAAKMGAMGHQYFYYENTEGGHGAGVTNKQIAFETALQYSYLWMLLGK